MVKVSSTFGRVLTVGDVAEIETTVYAYDSNAESRSVLHDRSVRSDLDVDRYRQTAGKRTTDDKDAIHVTCR